MSADLFQEYRGINARDGVAAAAVVTKENVKRLSQITGGTAVWHKIRGGSMVLSEILLHRESAKMGDYIVADRDHSFFVCKKAKFEERYSLKGPLRDPVV